MLLTHKEYTRFIENGKWLQSLLDGFSIERVLGLSPIVASPCVMIYGSSVAGTAFRDGDADYAIVFFSSSSHQELQKLRVTPSNFLEVEREHHQHVLSSILKHIVERCPSADLKHEQIFTARVPIVRLRRMVNGAANSILFDLSLSLDGIRNSLLLRLYMESDPRLRAGTLCLKRWGRSQKILDARGGWISPYALTVMYIFYMQKTGRTACVIDENEVDRILGFATTQLLESGEIGCSQLKESLPCTDANLSDVLADLQGFFQFFSDTRQFDFDVDVVDIRTKGKYLSKEMWFEVMEGIGGRERWGLLGYEVIMVRDPYEAHNLGRSVDFFRAESIREIFRLASDKSPEDLLVL